MAINREVHQSKKIRKCNYINMNTTYLLKLIINIFLALIIGSAFLFTYSNFFIVPFLIIMIKYSKKEYYYISFFVFLGVLFYYANKTHFFAYSSVIINSSILIKYFTSIVLVLLYKHFISFHKIKVTKFHEGVVSSGIGFLSGIILVIYYSFSIYHIMILVIEVLLSFVLCYLLEDGVAIFTLNRVKIRNTVTDFELLSITLLLFMIILSTNSISVLGFSVSKTLLVTLLAICSYYFSTLITFYITFIISFLSYVILQNFTLELLCIYSITFSTVALLPKKNKMLISVLTLVYFGILSNINSNFQNTITISDFKNTVLGSILFLTIDLGVLNEISKKYVFTSTNDYKLNEQNFLKLQDYINVESKKLLNNYKASFTAINNQVVVNETLLNSNNYKNIEAISSLKYLLQEQFNMSIKVFNNFFSIINSDLRKFINDENKIQTLLNKNNFNVLKVIVTETINDRLQIEIFIKNFLDTPSNKKKLLKLLKINTNKDFYISNSVLTLEEKFFVITLNEKPKISLSFEQCKLAKNNDEVSGDNYTVLHNSNGTTLVGISDGMGSGTLANKQSSSTLNLLDDLIYSNADIQDTLSLINAVELAKNEETFSTLDILYVNKHSGTADFYKFGSSPSYVLRNGKVKKFQSNSLPIGVVNDFEVTKNTLQLKNNDIIIMLTDGIFEANRNSLGKDEWLINLLEKGGRMRMKTLCDKIMHECILFGKKDIPEDDMLILGIKVKVDESE